MEAQTRATHEVEAGMKSATSAVLGEMVWLYSMSELHQSWPFGALQQWLVPAIAHKQYRLYHREGRPVGLVTWAWLSKDIETAYVRNTTSLQPKDWQSGDRGWLLDFIAPFGDAKRITQDLRHNVFPNDVGRFLRIRKNDETMRIMYVHGAKALEKARDRGASPTVELV